MSTPITAAQVNELRKRTDLPMMDCKAALGPGNEERARPRAPQPAPQATTAPTLT